MVGETIESAIYPVPYDPDAVKEDLANDSTQQPPPSRKRDRSCNDEDVHILCEKFIASQMKKMKLHQSDSSNNLKSGSNSNSSDNFDTVDNTTIPDIIDPENILVSDSDSESTTKDGTKVLSKNTVIHLLLQDRHLLVKALHNQNSTIRDLQEKYGKVIHDDATSSTALGKTFLMLSALQNYVLQYIRSGSSYVHLPTTTPAPLPQPQVNIPDVASSLLPELNECAMSDSENNANDNSNHLDTSSKVEETGTESLLGKKRTHTETSLDTFNPRKLYKLREGLLQYESAVERRTKLLEATAKNVTIDENLRILCHKISANAETTDPNTPQIADTLGELLAPAMPFEQAETIFHKLSQDDALFAFYDIESKRKLLNDSFSDSLLTQQWTRLPEIRLPPPRNSENDSPCKPSDDNDIFRRFPDVF